MEIFEASLKIQWEADPQTYRAPQEAGVRGGIPILRVVVGQGTWPK